MMKMQYKNIRSLLIVFAGSIMAAHGLRMMIQGLFFPSSYYPAPVPTRFDFWFDWFTLSVLGIIIFMMGLHEFYWMRKLKQTQNHIPSMQVQSQ